MDIAYFTGQTHGYRRIGWQVYSGTPWQAIRNVTWAKRGTMNRLANVTCCKWALFKPLLCLGSDKHSRKVDSKKDATGVWSRPTDYTLHYIKEALRSIDCQLLDALLSSKPLSTPLLSRFVYRHCRGPLYVNTGCSSPNAHIRAEVDKLLSSIRLGLQSSPARPLACYFVLPW